MVGKTISHYKILKKLGQGGMGVVYKAEDTKLERLVAIKFLPPEIASQDDVKKRFKIEAKAAAALNHPNIATIHQIEEVDDKMFIVMEYVEGQELRQLVKTLGSVPIDDAITYAIQIAEGLQAAHKKGVIHRDIKGANIMLSENGQVKIMTLVWPNYPVGPNSRNRIRSWAPQPTCPPNSRRGRALTSAPTFGLSALCFMKCLRGSIPSKGTTSRQWFIR